MDKKDIVKSFILKTQKNIDGLRSVLDKKENIILFIGSGFSTSAGYMSWNNLLDYLIDKLPECTVGKERIEDLKNLLNQNYDTSDKQNGASDFPKLALQIKEEYDKLDIIDHYYGYICKVYDEKDEINDEKIGVNAFHLNTLKLKHKAIITTNYDFHIEKILNPLSHLILDYQNENAFTLHSFIRNFSKTKPESEILHIHGAIENYNSIILSEDEYNEAYGFIIEPRQETKDSLDKSWTILSRLLWALFTFNHIIFIGFGLHDPFIDKMLSISCKDSWLWLNDNHYALMPFNSDIENLSERQKKIDDLNNKLGIKTILYDSKDGHEELNTLINDLIIEVKETHIPKRTIDPMDGSNAE